MKSVIIGTAGRTNRELLTPKVWSNMVAIAKEKVPKNSTGVSGGAAWADHLAVELYIIGHLSQLQLHLPAPLDNCRNYFVGGTKSAASASNYYHELFSNVIGRNTILDIVEATQTIGCGYTYQDPDIGFKALFIRNKLVANEVKENDMVLAFTWGIDTVEDSGTKNTWDQIMIKNKVHISMHDMVK